MLTCLPHVIAYVQGVIESGGVQWMTAGRGIIHSEMPKVTEGDLWGFQLWINLPKKDKMTPPQYALVKQILFHHHYGPFDRSLLLLKYCAFYTAHPGQEQRETQCQCLHSFAYLCSAWGLKIAVSRLMVPQNFSDNALDALQVSGLPGKCNSDCGKGWADSAGDGRRSSWRNWAGLHAQPGHVS